MIYSNDAVSINWAITFKSRWCTQIQYISYESAVRKWLRFENIKSCISIINAQKYHDKSQMRGFSHLIFKSSTGKVKANWHHRQKWYDHVIRMFLVSLAPLASGTGVRSWLRLLTFSTAIYYMLTLTCSLQVSSDTLLFSNLKVDCTTLQLQSSCRVFRVSTN